METIFLKLVHIMLRFFEALTGQDAFALLVHLEHMKFGFFSRPPKHGPKPVGEVIHKIDRVIPANNKITRLQARFGLFLCHFDRARQELWDGCFCHNRKLREERKVVELQQLELREQRSCLLSDRNPDKIRVFIKGAKAWSVAKKSEHSGVHFVQAVLLLGTFAKE